MQVLAFASGLLLAFIAAIPLSGESRPILDTADPLLGPKPPLASPMTPNASPGTGKLAFRGFTMPPLPHGQPVRVLVLLGAIELHPNGAESAIQLARVAWLEHEFVKGAAATGFAPLFGLSHFPVVVGEIDAAAISQLAASPYVVSVAPDIELATSRIEGASLIRTSRLRVETGSNGEGVGVAVVDAGVNSAHPELGGRVVFAKDYTGSGNSSDVDGHGTSVAGIIAGRYGGLAPAATIWNVRVLPGTLSTFLSGLNDLYANRNNFDGLDVVNLSIDSPTVFSNSDCDSLEPATTKIINSFDAAGIVIFAASGNQARRNGVSFPACLSKIVSVGAVYDADLGSPRSYSGAGCTDTSTAPGRIPCYSNSGEPLDVFAPADCARAPGLGSSYDDCFSGTSAAAPYASGVAALLISATPDVTPARLRSALSTTGIPVTAAGGVTRNRIDAVHAFSALAGAVCPAQAREMTCGSTVAGSLEDSDCATEGGDTHEFWSFDAIAGQTINATLKSGTFAPEIFLLRPDLTQTSSSMGTGRLASIADQTGEWWIEIRLPSSAGPRIGDYQLSVSCETNPPPLRRRPLRH